MLAQIPLRKNKIYFDQEWFKTKVTQLNKKMYSLIKRVSRKSDTSSTSKCTLSKKGSDTAIQQVTLRIRLSTTGFNKKCPKTILSSMLFYSVMSTQIHSLAQKQIIL
jgi:hypothetical protein